MLAPTKPHTTKGETLIIGLHIAAFFGLEKSTVSLLDGQHSPSLKDMRGRTPLHYAAENGI